MSISTGYSDQQLDFLISSQKLLSAYASNIHHTSKQNTQIASSLNKTIVNACKFISYLQNDRPPKPPSAKNNHWEKIKEHIKASDFSDSTTEEELLEFQRACLEISSVGPSKETKKTSTKSPRLQKVTHQAMLIQRAKNEFQKNTKFNLKTLHEIGNSAIDNSTNSFSTFGIIKTIALGALILTAAFFGGPSFINSSASNSPPFTTTYPHIPFSSSSHPQDSFPIPPYPPELSFLYDTKLSLPLPSDTAALLHDQEEDDLGNFQANESDDTPFPPPSPPKQVSKASIASSPFPLALPSPLFDFSNHPPFNAEETNIVTFLVNSALTLSTDLSTTISIDELSQSLRQYVFNTHPEVKSFELVRHKEKIDILVQIKDTGAVKQNPTSSFLSKWGEQSSSETTFSVSNPCEITKTLTLLNAASRARLENISASDRIIQISADPTKENLEVNVKLESGTMLTYDRNAFSTLPDLKELQKSSSASQNPTCVAFPTSHAPGQAKIDNANARLNNPSSISQIRNNNALPLIEGPQTLVKSSLPSKKMALQATDRSLFNEENTFVIQMKDFPDETTDDVLPAMVTVNIIGKPVDFFPKTEQKAIAPPQHQKTTIELNRKELPVSTVLYNPLKKPAITEEEVIETNLRVQKPEDNFFNRIKNVFSSRVAMTTAMLATIVTGGKNRN